MVGCNHVIIVLYIVMTSLHSISQLVRHGNGFSRVFSLVLFRVFNSLKYLAMLKVDLIVIQFPLVSQLLGH